MAVIGSILGLVAIIAAAALGPRPAAAAPGGPDRALAGLADAGGQSGLHEWTSGTLPLEVRRGQLVGQVSLSDTLQTLGAPRDAARAAALALLAGETGKGVVAGSGLAVRLGAEGELRAVSASLADGRVLLVKRDADHAWKVHALAPRTEAPPRRYAGYINDSLGATLRKDGVPARAVSAFASLYAHDAAARRTLQKARTYELIHEPGEGILFASVSGNDFERAFYQVQASPSDAPEYFDAGGQGAAVRLMRRPVAATRVSSPFGMRRHPILNRRQMHRGVDLAAPRGAPVYAAEAGVVTRKGRNGAYGNYLRLRHPGGIETAYAHLSAFGDALELGSVVRRGDIVGRVGSTGLSTAPHLHFEVAVNGRAVDPLTLGIVPGRNVLASPDTASAFKARRSEIDALRLRLAEEGQGRAPAQLAGAFSFGGSL